ncbi:hypothetical protein Taro_019282 [Colocasia esculenta]|uniref:Uncharacterized protein n=1 Tax=Colocasia esculenta TaxID=4460 RepID=A0A843UVX3_COLES|nr:hypothetical protein [Colocasia esculenta]
MTQVFIRWKETKEHTMCRRAMSNDFFEIVLPNPVLSAATVDLAVVFGTALSRSMGFGPSGGLESCPLLCSRRLGELSGSLPLVTTGDIDCLRFELAGGAASA